MKNYGESLVYWYFRLNGFIPMSNFVLHGNDTLKGSDCDLVAVRFPHVYENVGGQENDWDNELLSALGHDGSNTLVAFVQVKTGRGDGDQVASIANYFTHHLEYLVARIGLWPQEQASQMASRFNESSQYPHEQFVLTKMVVLRKPRNRRQPQPWIDWPFARAIRFVMERMEKYASHKYEDRMHFPDPIVQLLADQAQTPEHRWPKN